jgi:hypothetical protein
MTENWIPFPSDLHTTLKEYILFPGENRKVEGGLLMNELPSNTRGEFNPGYNISLKLSKRLTLKELTRLVNSIQHYLEPIHHHMEMLVFFKLRKSVMFRQYHQLNVVKLIQKFMENDYSTSSAMSTSVFSYNQPLETIIIEETKKMNIVVESLNMTMEFIEKLNKGNATYNEIIAEGQLHLENLDIDREFKILGEFRHQQTSEGLLGVRNMLELFQYTDYILKIHAVCKQYHLQGCLGDPILLNLVHIAKGLVTVENRNELTLNRASDLIQRVKYLFGGKNTAVHCLKLFEEVSNSATFFHFIKDKHFDGDEGQVAFTQQYQLITAQLQHEGYDEQVLNHLFVAFKIMSPFLNTKQSFKSLMDKIAELGTCNGLIQLGTVNSNITLVKLWFSRAEGDTIQNVANELECIIKTGCFIFTLVADGGSMTLEYLPFAKPYLMTVSPAENDDNSDDKSYTHYNSCSSSHCTTVPSSKEIWSSEQIHDFVLKLGFLNAEKEGGSQIKHFLCISEVWYKYSTTSMVL